MTTLRRVQVVTAALAVVFAVAWADRVTGGWFSLPLVFVLPVAFSASMAGLSAGLTVGLIAAGLWTGVLEAEAGRVAIWNFALRVGVFGAIALVAARTFHIIESERTLARTDGLTGLANRRAISDALGAILQNRRASDRPITVLLLDVDNFKQINDRHGHAEGDAVLRSVGQALRAATREEDIVGRLGGDEFLVVLRGSDAAAAKVVADRLRSYLARHRPGVTLSIGGVVAPDARSTDAVLHAADRLLYEAKRAGKDALRVRAA